MRLLAATLSPVRRLFPAGDGLVTLTLLSLVVGLELTGRVARSDLHDGLAGLVLLAGIALVAARHRRQPVGWLTWLGRVGSRLLGRFERGRYEHGIDLRGLPRLPRKIPPAVWLLVGAVVAWSGLAAILWAVYPAGWRELGLRTSYVLYLVLLMGLWTGLLLCAVAGLYVPILMFDRRLREVIRPVDRRGAELILLAGYALSVAAVAWLIPIVVVLALCLGVAFFAFLAVLRTGDDEPSIVWRAGGPSTPICAVPLRRLVAGGLGLLAIVVFNLLLTACGGRLLTPPDPSDAMPVTTLLGTTAAWMIPGLVIAGAIRLWTAQQYDPALRTKPTIAILGGTPTDRAAAATLLTQAGWEPRLVEMRVDGELAIRLVSPVESEAMEFDPRWPLKVCLADLSVPVVKDRLARRDEIRLRRQAFRGLSALFKRAIAERTTRGGGYWFAPQWWFITGLDREDPHRGRGNQPTPPHPVGPPFYRAFPPRVRQHFHQVLRAVQIDMIFIEDGVSYRSVEKVLRAMFEIYDVHGGRRKAEDHLFRGIPKVRVMVHDYAPGKPFRVSDYQEPQFDDLSRARVLHIFRDHGGSESLEDVPFDFSWEPSPALGFDG